MFLLGTYSFKSAFIPFLYKRKSSPWSYLTVWECELSTQRESFACDWVSDNHFPDVQTSTTQHYTNSYYYYQKKIILHHFQNEIARGLGINLWYSISLSIMIFSEALGSETSRCTTEVSVGGSNVAWYTSVE